MMFEEEGQLAHLTDHECPHGAFPDDKVARCECWTGFDLQSRVDALRSGRAPLPMTDGQAAWQALRLRAKGMTYSQIGVVMSLYHGHWFEDHHWRRVCRQLGAAPVTRGFPASERATAKRVAPSGITASCGTSEEKFGACAQSESA